MGHFLHGSSHCTVNCIFPGVELAGTTIEKRVRLFLLVLVCQMLIPGRSSRVLARYLESLKDLGYVLRYSWDSLAYNYLLYEMKYISRTAFRDLVGMASLWRVLEVFTTPFEFLYFLIVLDPLG